MAEAADNIQVTIPPPEADKVISPTPVGRKRTPSDFSMDRVIGEGSFGQVYSATEKETGRKFAIKVLDKRYVIKHKKAKYVQTEKEIMNMLDHPNVVKLYYTFQDAENLYYVMELCPHGELFRWVKRLSSFDVSSTKFYTADIVLALEHLHGKGVIHRDLKPENLLFGEDFHLKLIDFGTAKVIGNEKNARSNSFCGTAEYVSPELLQEKVAYKCSDLWALGCIIYQLLAGRPPFKHHLEYQIFQKILHEPVEFPAGFPEDAKDLVLKLMNKNPEERLGAVCDAEAYEAIKAHPFFSGVNWDTHNSTQGPQLMPYLPDPEATDCSGSYGSNDFELPVEEEKTKMSESSLGSDRQPLAQAAAGVGRLSLTSAPWSQFLFDDESIVYSGMVSKKKGLFSKKRQLILTSAPRLIYIDADRMIQKGEILWSDKMKVELKTKTLFFIHTPQRTYYIDDYEQQDASRWVTAIEKMLQQMAEKNAEDATTQQTAANAR